MHKNLLSILITFLFLGLIIPMIQSQSNVTFGKNRVQYSDDFQVWSQYETTNFIVYWYGKGRYVGQAVVQLGELDFPEIENLIEHKMNEKIEIIVYSDLSDMLQSNLGKDESFTGSNDLTKVIGNKVFVYFNGNHKHLRRQVREGIAGVLLNSMYFGANIQEIVQNILSNNIPNWFKSGIAAFIGETWNSDIDNELRNRLLDTKRYRNFRDLEYDNPVLAGHSMWYYLTQTYGRRTVPNLLYLSRINRNLESAFLYVLGTPLKTIEKDWYQYYYNRYSAEKGQFPEIDEESLMPLKSKKTVKIANIKSHPLQNKLAVVENEIGKYRVFLYDIDEDEKSLIFNYGFRNAIQPTDYNYPLISFSKNGLNLAILNEERDIVKLRIIDVASQEILLEEDFDPMFHRIHSMDYRNHEELVLSATIDGVSDLFTYNTRTKIPKRITNDFWDDKDASYVNYGEFEGILFSSNRTSLSLERQRLDSIMPVKNFDLYFLELADNYTITQVTSTLDDDEWMAIQSDSSRFSYTNNQTGILSRYGGYLERKLDFYQQNIIIDNGSKIVIHEDSIFNNVDSLTIDTTYLTPVYKYIGHTRPEHFLGRNIQAYTSSISRPIFYDAIRSGKKNFYIPKAASTGSATVPKNTAFKSEELDFENIFTRELEENGGDLTNKRVNFAAIDSNANFITIVRTDTIYPINPGYLFQSEFGDIKNISRRISINRDTLIIERKNHSAFRDSIGQSSLIAEGLKLSEGGNYPSVEKFRPAAIVPYRIKFKTDFVTAKLDNNQLFEGLESFDNSDGQFENPKVGFLLKANLKDILEDYQIEVGVRVPTDLKGVEYFITVDDNKKRLDKRYVIYRKLENQIRNSDNQLTQFKTSYRVLLGQFQVRYPLDVFRSIRGRVNLRNDKVIELATDAATLGAPNANTQRLGLKFEYVFDNTLEYGVNLPNGTKYKAYAEFVKSFDLDTSDGFKLSSRPGIMTVLGFDARHYQRFARHTVLALRASGATAVGKEKILYFLGATENWIRQEFNDEISIAPGNYAFQTHAPSLRGHLQNIRNGNSYLLFNAELRIPIFRYFSKRLRSSFFQNFQLVGFFDYGTAWSGNSPFSDNNPINVITVNNPPVIKVDINLNRDPFVAGFGPGARLMLFGYMLRFDYAWGLESGIVKDPRLFVSLGLDF